MLEDRAVASSAFSISLEHVTAILRGEVRRESASDALVSRAREAFTRGIDEDARFRALQRNLGLDALDLEIVAVLLAAEAEPSLEKVFAFAIDDFTKKRPDATFLAHLIAGFDAQLQDAVRARLDHAAPLKRLGVVLATGTAELPASARSHRLNDRVVSFLRGQKSIDELVHTHVRESQTVVRTTELVIDRDALEQLRRALDRPAPRILVAGPDGVGKALAVEALQAERGETALRIDLAGLVREPDAGERVRAALREAALRGAAAVFEGPGLSDDLPTGAVRALADAATSVRVPIILALTTRPQWPTNTFADLVEIVVRPPTFAERHLLWQRELPPPVATEHDLESVAARYAFTAGTIARTARRARGTAMLRDERNPRVTLDELGDAARLTFSNRLGNMAQRIATGFTWDDLVLPKDTLEAVREVVRFAHHRPYLLDEWGFASKLPYGRGVSAILAGPPGTGKTMVAQLLAKELGYDLYRIDLSQVVNKYIGETEKNLAKIFDEAETSHAILFFDEADSLFAKRTDVKSSNDRYANLEVNYLLQRMETYDGVTLLATNLEQGLDEAFKRRVRFSIAFEIPDEDVRRTLWRSMFPPQTPLAPDIDWALIAKKFEMAGGYIKKAALRAALVAVETKRPITTADLPS
jgi:AAA+ superfamily predicted ATPase